jgi:hypothetical protein
MKAVIKIPSYMIEKNIGALAGVTAACGVRFVFVSRI